MARQNDHTRAEELMSAYLDKRLSVEEKDFFERHIASCADCHAQLEATRSLVGALRAMPLVKASRSFVLPREMAKQPKRSFMNLYPALRLATVVAAMAFAILFASDLLIVRSGGSGAQQFIPAAAPVPLEVQAPTAARQAAPTQESAAEAANAASTTASGGTEPPGTDAPSPKAAVSETVTMTDAMTYSVTVATPATTATAEVVMRAQTTVEATPELAAPMYDQQDGPVSGFSTQSNFVSTQPAIDPLRVIEIALLVLAIMLGIATFVVRRKRA